MKFFDFLGVRVIKTGVAIFLTALICQLLGLPPVFAVITAIVTLEPTVSDSIKKGLVRFPASAIGSAFAVFFIAIFGNSPITYTLAAVFTIVTCYKLKLHAGLLVATITAVAMIEVVYDNYFLSFLTRLGTTSIGLIVSIIVNMFILPPNYIKEIGENINRLYKNIGKATLSIVTFDADSSKNKNKLLVTLDKQILKTSELIRFQKDETDFHPLVGSNKQDFYIARKQINRLKLMVYHLTNLKNLSLDDVLLTTDEKLLIENAVESLAEHMIHQTDVDLTVHELTIKRLMQTFWLNNNVVTHELTEGHLPNELILLYEVSALMQLAYEFDLVKNSIIKKEKAVLNQKTD